MRKHGPVSERLRSYVRERVRKDGPAYEWGNGARLAKAIGVEAGWITTYTDDPPTSHATIDQALAICDFYGVAITDFQRTKKPSGRPTEHPLVQGAVQAIAAYSGDATVLLSLVNTMRRLAGLPDMPVTRARKRGRPA